MQYDDQNGYAGPDAGVVAAGVPPSPLMDFNPGGPMQPAPIMNGTPQMHPLENLAQLLHEHTGVIRQRLLAAHAQQGLAPQLVSEHGQTRVNPLDIVRQTRATGSQNLAALLARFHRNLPSQGREF